jgi:MFS family permease
MTAPKNVKLILMIAIIGFLFDTYELLMTPLVASPALAELLGVPINNPLVTTWVGNLLWIAALSGGVFGLMGGYLVDWLGRKKVMVGSILCYSFSPFLAAYSESLGAFVFFRSLTFVGVCVEFVAAVAWISELFEDKQQRQKWLGITQAFASLGGLLVTLVSVGLQSVLNDLPQMGLPVALGASGPSSWRYLLMTGIFPAIPIMILLFFVPESQVWLDKKRKGSLARPSFLALFASDLKQKTWACLVLSACAYGVAFGALQITVARLAPGLPEMKDNSKMLAPLRKEAERLNVSYNQLQEAGQDTQQIMKEIKENFKLQSGPLSQIKKSSETLQLLQELGGLVGRIGLAILLALGVMRMRLLKGLLWPLFVILPMTYFVFYNQGGVWFNGAYFLCGLFTVAQFSFFGEVLPKIFPLHLRGTGSSFATNVGGRMLGTSMSFVTSSALAPWFAGGVHLVVPHHIAKAAGVVSLSLIVIGLVVVYQIRSTAFDAANEDS